MNEMPDDWYLTRATSRTSAGHARTRKRIHYYHKGLAVCGHTEEFIRLVPIIQTQKLRCKSCKIMIATYQDLDNKSV